MRDLAKYQSEYNSLPFEKYIVAYRRKKIIEILDKYKPKRILEVGCGQDSLFNHYKNFDFFAVIEPSDTFYIKANNEAISFPNTKVFYGFVEDYSYLLHSLNFDFIIVSSLLHEIEDTKKLLDSIKIISLENTVIHFNVPNAKSFHRYLALEMGIINDIFEKSEMQKIMQQTHTFDIKDLINTLKDHELTVLESGSYFIKPFTHSQMQNILDLNLLPKNFLDGLYAMASIIPDLGAEIFVNVKKEKNN
jgi:SAM-dependent methyltransferase